MRLSVVGVERREVEPVAAALGFEVVRRDPEIVLCHGGDGSLLRAERLLPGIPKVPTRHERTSRLCELHRVDSVLRRLLQGRLERTELPLLELRVGRTRFHALNDVVLRNDNPALAVRFRYLLGEFVSDEYTGDGLVIATAFGSTAYYRSITGRTIESGIALAFNNCTRSVDPIELPGDRPLTVILSRGPAALVHDNDTRTIVMREGHRFQVRLSERKAVVLGLDALACQRCQRGEGGGFNPH